MTLPRRDVLAFVLAMTGMLAAMPAAAEPISPRPLAPGHWPAFRGPDRTNRSPETGLLTRWPAGGPKRLWTARGIGEGFATVSIAGGRIFTAGSAGGKTVVTALDGAGRRLWQSANGRAWKQGRLSGARGTPTVDGGRVYHESPHGNLVCLDAATGKRIWGLNILQQFGGTNIRWALAESVLIDGDRVICCPGGPRAGMVALDKATGKTVWVCRELSDKAGYASPMRIEYKGARLIVTMTADAAVGVDADTGRLHWRIKHGNPRGTNCPSPVYHQGRLFLDTGASVGGKMLRLTVAAGAAGRPRVSAEVLWETQVDNHHGGVILSGGHLYTSTDKYLRGQWVCLAWSTGKQTCVAPGVGKGSATWAEGMLYTFGEKGRQVALVPAEPQKHKAVSTFRIPEGGNGPTWAYPVVCGGRLYLRHGDFLYAYDVRDRSRRP